MVVTMALEKVIAGEIQALAAVVNTVRPLCDSNNLFVSVAAQRVLTIVEDALYELDSTLDLPWQLAPSKVDSGPSPIPTRETGH